MHQQDRIKSGFRYGPARFTLLVNPGVPSAFGSPRLKPPLFKRLEYKFAMPQHQVYMEVQPCQRPNKHPQKTATRAVFSTTLIPKGIMVVWVLRETYSKALKDLETAGANYSLAVIVAVDDAPLGSFGSNTSV